MNRNCGTCRKPQEGHDPPYFIQGLYVEDLTILDPDVTAILWVCSYYCLLQFAVDRVLHERGSAWLTQDMFTAQDRADELVRLGSLHRRHAPRPNVLEQTGEINDDRE